MHLTINLANVKPAVDYVSRIGGLELSRKDTAMWSVMAMNFKPTGVVVEGDTLVVYCTHPGDASACARWVASALCTSVILTE